MNSQIKNENQVQSNGLTESGERITPLTRIFVVVGLLAVALFVAPKTALAATCSSQSGGGNWSTVGTWSCGRVPGSTATADTAVITTGNPVTVTASNGTNNVTALTVNASATLTINTTITLTIGGGASATNAGATVNGTITNAGTLTPSGTGTITFNSGSTYTHNQNGGTIPTATWNANSTLQITGATSTNPGGSGQGFGNVTWNCAGQ